VQEADAHLRILQKVLKLLVEAAKGVVGNGINVFLRNSDQYFAFTSATYLETLTSLCNKPWLKATYTQD
jgi:hypothetical protein